MFSNEALGKLSHLPNNFNPKKSASFGEFTANLLKCKVILKDLLEFSGRK